MKKFMLLLMSASILFAISSCDEQQPRKDGKKTQKHYREKYREKQEQDRQERRW